MIRLFAGLVVALSVVVAPAAQWVKIDGREAHPTRILAKLKAGQNVARLGAAAPDIDVSRSYSEIPGLLVVEAKDQAALKAAVAGDPDPAAGLKKKIKDLKGTGMFEYVEPDYVRRPMLTPTDRFFFDGTLWGLNNTGQNLGVPGADIDVVRAWDITTGDTNLVVAVIDTGVRYTHRDLAAQMWRNPGEIPGNGIDDDNNGFIDDVFGINAITDTGDPMDDAGHGTHVAGTIGAAANDGNGHVGVIWNVRIMALKFLAEDGGVDSDAIQCINYAMSKNVKISNNSWGGYGFDQALFDAINAARSRGHLFVAAAGNDANDNDGRTPAYPASYNLDNIISVAALDRRDELAFFSNYGANSVDIGAPGVEIYSTYFGSDTDYQFLQGTSMASPHVTGGAALLWANDPTATYQQIRDKLLQRSTRIPALTGKTSTGARMDVFKAISGNIDGVLELFIVPSAGTPLLTNSSRTFMVKVTDDLNVNNATVVGRFGGVNYTFLNNGQAPDTNSADGLYTATVQVPATIGSYTFSIDVTAPGKAPAHLDATYDVLPAPPNDFFVNATKIPSVGAIVEGDNRLATPEPFTVVGDPGFGPDTLEPLHAGISRTRSLWWSWSTPTATPVIIDAAGTSFDDDAVLGVYRGASLSVIEEVASSGAVATGSNGTRAPYVKFDAEPNVTYRIAVAQSLLSTNSPGRVVLRVEPRGDVDITPPTIEVTNFLSGQVIRQATNVIELMGVANDPAPNASGVKQVDITTLIDQVGRSALGTTNWRSGPIQLVEGENRIAFTATDRADNQSAQHTITLWYSPIVEYNDAFGKATVLTGSSGVTSVSSTNASREFNEPFHAGNEGGKSLWWSFVPPSNGVLALSTEGSTFDTLLALYTITNPTNRSLGDLTLVASNDDSTAGGDKHSEIAAGVTGGQRYFIAVDGYGGAEGIARLTYSFASIDVFHVTFLTESNGVVTPSSGDYPAGSAITATATNANRYLQFQDFQVATGGTTNTITVNPYTFSLTGPTTVRARFGTRTFTDDFERGDLLTPLIPWSTSNVVANVINFTPNWRIEQQNVTNTTSAPQGHLTRVARTIENLPNNSSSSLILVTNLLATTASQMGSFEFRVSSESGFDKAEFLLDGQVVGTWSGEVPWTVLNFTIPVGRNPRRLEWRYTKDFAGNGGPSTLDAFMIDTLSLPTAPPDSTTPISISFRRSPSAIVVQGPPATDLILEGSTTLLPNSWTQVGSEQRTTQSGATTFELGLLSSPYRFFRVRTP